MVDLPPIERFDWDLPRAWWKTKAGGWLHWEELRGNHRLVEQLTPDEQETFAKARDKDEGKVR